jgi:hypothetical protein
MAGGWSLFQVPRVRAYFWRELCLADLIDDPRDVYEIGRWFLKNHPLEANLEFLSETLLVKNSFSLPDFRSCRKKLLETIREDYRSKETLIADGWVLSVTEARFYALLTLLNERRSPKQAKEE